MKDFPISLALLLGIFLFAVLSLLVSLSYEEETKHMLSRVDYFEQQADSLAALGPNLSSPNSHHALAQPRIEWANKHLENYARIERLWQISGGFALVLFIGLLLQKLRSRPLSFKMNGLQLYFISLALCTIFTLSFLLNQIPLAGSGPLYTLFCFAFFAKPLPLLAFVVGAKEHPSRSIGISLLMFEAFTIGLVIFFYLLFHLS